MEKTIDQKIIECELKISTALNNAKKQKYRMQQGMLIRVRHQFWEQVAMDYKRELKKLKSVKNNIKNA